MESLPANHNNGQSYGYTLYQTDIYSGGDLNSKNHVRDRALVSPSGLPSTNVIMDDNKEQIKERILNLFFLKVFIDRELIGVLDYRTQKVKVPHSKVSMMQCWFIKVLHKGN